ncbi:hypothetical protein RFI_16362, partial [Reticulomyxa filosa]
FNNNNQWPLPYESLSRQSGNLFMRLYAEVENRYKYFSFEWDGLFEYAQREYKEKVSTNDPNDMLHLLGKYPYHIDTLLSVSNYMTQIGRLEEASDLIERCLYRLERAFHPQMLRYFRNEDNSSSSSSSSSEVQLRLCYDIPSNRSFYYALWKYSQNVGRRGCVHTAFELTKYLLSLSPSRDPLCTLLCVDYWALRCYDWVWILSFANHWILDCDTQASVRMLPNWCFSCALAKYKLEKECIEDKQSLKKAQKKAKQSCISCDIAPGQMDRSKVPLLESSSSKPNLFLVSSSMLLQQAILMFPEVIAPLLVKVEPRLAQEHKWQTIMAHKFFIDAKLRRQEVGSLGKLCDIYAERCHVLWKGSDVLDWLHKHCVFVLERLDRPLSFPSSNNNHSTLSHSNDTGLDQENLAPLTSIPASMYDEKANHQRFRMLDLNDFSDVITTLPLDALPEAMGAARIPNLQQLLANNNPINNNIFNNIQNVDLPQILQRQIEQGNTILQQHPVVAFFYSLLPWVNPLIVRTGQNQQIRDNINNDNLQ